MRLDRRTQLLYDDAWLFVNGDALRWPSPGATLLRRLANERALPGSAIAAAAPGILHLLYDWYRHGYLDPDAA